jgi:hypothetical protein
MKQAIKFTALFVFYALLVPAQIAPGGSAGVQLNSLGRGYLFETKNFRLGLLQPYNNENGSFNKPSVEFRYPFQQEKLSMGTRFGGYSGWSIYPQISGGLTIFNEKPLGQNTQQKS